MKKILTLAGAALVMASAVASEPLIVAHRGYHRAEGSAQNSIRALVKADSIGAYASEFDVWMSADSVMYVNHNVDINGVVIETSTSEVLDTCHLKNGEVLPRLDAFLDVAKELKVGLVFELKPHQDKGLEAAAVARGIEMIAERGLTDRTMYITFSRHAYDLFVRDSGRPVQYLNAMEPAEVESSGGAGADFHINVYRENPTWIDDLHARGLKVNVWTVDSEENLQWCIDNGADFITTNEPERAMRMAAGCKE